LRAYVAGQISAAELCAKLPGRTWDAIESQQRVLGLVQQHKPIYYRIDSSIRDIVSEESSSRRTSQENNVPYSVDLHQLVALAMRVESRKA
jgi:hypothetical protein